MLAILAPTVAAIAALAIFILWRSRQRKQKSLDDYATRDVKVPLTNPYEDIEPLHNFDWTIEPQLKVRPFKDKYHLTMGMDPDTLQFCSARLTAS